MNISGILVMVAPAQTGAMVELLQGMPGIDVHYTDAGSGRIIITQEGESIHAEVDGLKRIRALPGIILAEMSYHNFEDDAEILEAIPPELEDEDLDRVKVPASLKDIDL